MTIGMKHGPRCCGSGETGEVGEAGAVGESVKLDLVSREAGSGETGSGEVVDTMAQGTLNGHKNDLGLGRSAGG